MTNRIWNKRLKDKEKRIDQVKSLTDGRIIPTERITEALEKIIQPGDRVILEGNNQKQASFLSQALVASDPQIVHDLHMIMSSITSPEHLDIFE